MVALATSALQRTAVEAGVHFPASAEKELLRMLENLPPYDDVTEGLEELQHQNYRLAVLSNSSESSLRAKMNSAVLADYFDEMLSVESVGKYKPDPQTYRWAAQTLGVPLGRNPATSPPTTGTSQALYRRAAGPRTWRARRTYNPYYPTPDIMASTMTELAEKIVAAEQEVFAAPSKTAIEVWTSNSTHRLRTQSPG